MKKYVGTQTVQTYDTLQGKPINVDAKLFYEDMIKRRKVKVDDTKKFQDSFVQ